MELQTHFQNSVNNRPEDEGTSMFQVSGLTYIMCLYFYGEQFKDPTIKQEFLDKQELQKKNKVQLVELDALIELHFKIFKNKGIFSKTDLQSSSNELCLLISGSHNPATKKFTYRNIQEILNHIMNVEQISEKQKQQVTDAKDNLKQWSLVKTDSLGELPTKSSVNQTPITSLGNDLLIKEKSEKAEKSSMENEIKRKLSIPLHHDVTTKSPAFLPKPMNNLRQINSMNLDNRIWDKFPQQKGMSPIQEQVPVIFQDRNPIRRNTNKKMKSTNMVPPIQEMTFQPQLVYIMTRPQGRVATAPAKRKNRQQLLRNKKQPKRNRVPNDNEVAEQKRQRLLSKTDTDKEFYQSLSQKQKRKQSHEVKNEHHSSSRKHSKVFDDYEDIPEEHPKETSKKHHVQPFSTPQYEKRTLDHNHVAKLVPQYLRKNEESSSSNIKYVDDIKRRYIPNHIEKTFVEKKPESDLIDTNLLNL